MNNESYSANDSTQLGNLHVCGRAMWLLVMNGAGLLANLTMMVQVDKLICLVNLTFCKRPIQNGFLDFKRRFRFSQTEWPSVNDLAIAETGNV